MNSQISSYKSIAITLFIFITSTGWGSVENFDKAISLAQQSNKNIFVNYTASWCLPCQIFGDQVLTNNNVASLLSSDFVVLKADYDNGETKHLYGDYAVCCLPTLQVIDEEGALLASLSNTLDANEFLKQLKKYVSKDKIIRSPLPGAKNTDAINLDKSAKTYYTLQVGAFSKHQNALKQKSEIEKRISKSVFIIEDKIRKLYILNVGKSTIKDDLQPTSLMLKEAGVVHFFKRKNMNDTMLDKGI